MELLHRRNGGGEPHQPAVKSGHNISSADYNDRVQPTPSGRLTNGSAERPLKFSIDNILRPEFGGGTSPAGTAPAVFSPYNHHHYLHQHHHHIQHQQHLNNIDRLSQLNYQLHHLNRLQQAHCSATATCTSSAACLNDSSSASAAAAASSSSSSLSDHEKSNRSRRSSSSSTVEPPSSPIDLSCSDSQTSSVANPSMTTACNTASTTTITSATSSDSVDAACSDDKEGGGSQQWPAWVYCTRYSDRPSSGKSCPA